MDDAPYRGPIIDPHMHLWDLAQRRHPWLAPDNGGVGALGDLDALRRNYLPDDYRADAAGQNVVASVHIEAGWDAATPLDETRWLETLDKRDGIARRYVAAAALEAPDVEALLDAHLAFPRVCGIRSKVSWHTDPARRFTQHMDLMTTPAWLAGVRAVGRRGLHLEIMLYPAQAETLARVAQACPGQQIIVNHCASPIDQDAAGMALWRAAIARLGGVAHIALKISNVGAYVQPATRDAVEEIALRCIDAFGPARCMFASDYPVAGLHTPFAGIMDAFRHAARRFAPAEQAALFHDNAARLYRLDRPVAPCPVPA